MKSTDKSIGEKMCLKTSPIEQCAKGKTRQLIGKPTQGVPQNTNRHSSLLTIKGMLVSTSKHQDWQDHGKDGARMKEASALVGYLWGVDGCAPLEERLVKEFNTHILPQQFHYEEFTP